VGGRENEITWQKTLEVFDLHGHLGGGAGGGGRDNVYR
jgi:hypothetical protein